MSFLQGIGYFPNLYGLAPMNFRATMSMGRQSLEGIWWCDQMEMQENNRQIMSELLNLDELLPTKTRDAIIEKHMKKAIKLEAPSSGLKIPELEVPSDFFEKMEICDIGYLDAPRQVLSPLEVDFKSGSLETNWKVGPLEAAYKPDLQKQEPQGQNGKPFPLTLIKVGNHENKMVEAKPKEDAIVEMEVDSDVIIVDGENPFSEIFEGKSGFRGAPALDKENVPTCGKKPGSCGKLIDAKSCGNVAQEKGEKELKAVKAPAPIIKNRPKRKETESMRRSTKMYARADENDRPVAGRRSAERQLAFRKAMEANEAFKPTIVKNAFVAPVKYPSLRDAILCSVKGSANRFKCLYCHRAFQQRYKWVNHVKIHIGTLLHKCSCVRCHDVTYRDYRTMRKNHNDLYK